MSTEQSAKNLSVAVAYIAIDATSNIAKALRNFLTAMKYSYQTYGEKEYKNYLKESKGHFFKNEMDFVHVTMDKKQSDVERMAVTDEDRKIIEKYTRRMGIDYCLIKRPNDLDRLIEKKFINGEELNSNEEKIVRAFTFRDNNGKTIMDPENPKKPLVNDAAYMLTIATKDLNKWEYITRELEIRSHNPPLKQRLKDAKVMKRTYEKFVQNRQKAREKKQAKDKGKERNL